MYGIALFQQMMQISEQTIQPHCGERRQEISDDSGRARLGDKQIIQGMKDHGQRQTADYCGKGENFKTLCGDEPDSARTLTMCITPTARPRIRTYVRLPAPEVRI